MPNHALVDLDPVLRPGPMGRGLELRARIANYADAPSDRIAIRVRHGDALVGGGDVTLKADENRWAAMPLDWRGAGSDSAQSSAAVLIEADQDALAPDDRWFAVLGAPGRLRVLRVTEPREGSASPRFASLALDPGKDGRTGFTVDEVPPADSSASRGRATTWCCSRTSRRSPPRVNRACARFSGTEADSWSRLARTATPATTVHGSFPASSISGSMDPSRRRRGPRTSSGHGCRDTTCSNGLNVAVGAPLTESRLTGVMKARTLTTQPEIVVQTTGGLPLVVTAPGVAVFLSSLSDDWGDLPYSGAFVPLVRGLVSYAAQAEAGGPGSTRVGDAPPARLDLASRGGGLRARSGELQLAGHGPRGRHRLPRAGRRSGDPAGLLRFRIRRPLDRHGRGQRIFDRKRSAPLCPPILFERPAATDRRRSAA